MTLVLGATGRLGRLVVDGLVAAGAGCRPVSRDPARAAALARPGVEPVVLDVADADALERALTGVDRLFLCLPTSREQAALERGVVDAAARTGTPLVKLAWVGAGMETDVPFGVWHREIEEHLAGAGVPHTIVRSSSFVQHLWGELIAPRVREGGAFRLSAGDGRVAAVDLRDVADVCVRLLLAGEHEGRALDLTGPEALSFAEAAAVVAAAADRPVAYVDAPEEDVRAELLALGHDAWFAAALIRLYRLYRADALAAVSPDLEAVLGRPGRRFAEWAREARDLFVAP
ncbi:MAG: NAD(P)H-binding protein [Thermoleophilia bacterium]